MSTVINTTAPNAGELLQNFVMNKKLGGPLEWEHLSGLWTAENTAGVIAIPDGPEGVGVPAKFRVVSQGTSWQIQAPKELIPQPIQTKYPDAEKAKSMCASINQMLLASRRSGETLNAPAGEGEAAAPASPAEGSGHSPEVIAAIVNEAPADRPPATETASADSTALPPCTCGIGGGDQPVGPIHNQSCPRYDTAVEKAPEPVKEPEAAAAAPVAPPAPFHAADLDETMWVKILEARAAEKEAEDEVDALSEQLKEAKKDHEKASVRLGVLLDEARKGGEATLFNIPKTSEAKAAPIADAPTAPAEPAAAPVASTDETWRGLKLADLKSADGKKLTPGIVKSLEENKPGLVTMGDLADWVNLTSKAHGGNNELTDIEGIGAKAAEKIQAVMDQCWKDHPREAVQPRKDAVVMPPAENSPAATDDGYKPLSWEYDDETKGYVAENTAGDTFTDESGTVPTGFFIDPAGDRFKVEIPMVAIVNGESLMFDTVEAAKEFCEGKNRWMVSHVARAIVDESDSQSKGAPAEVLPIPDENPSRATLMQKLIPGNTYPGDLLPENYVPFRLTALPGRPMAVSEWMGDADADFKLSDLEDVDGRFKLGAGAFRVKSGA